MRNDGIDCSYSRYEKVDAFCECGDEPSAFIECVEVLY
jgi:hypothetical protein